MNDCDDLRSAMILCRALCRVLCRVLCRSTETEVKRSKAGELEHMQILPLRLLAFRMTH
jgi:hypothetical protein